MERICSKCGGSEWEIDLFHIVDNQIPYTCLGCGQEIGVDNSTVYFEYVA
jgi:hypothetical protein